MSPIVYTTWVADLMNYCTLSDYPKHIPMPNVNHILTVSVTTVDIVTHQKINSYINNAVSSFISSCFKTRDTFLEDLKNRENISHSSWFGKILDSWAYANPLADNKELKRNNILK